MKFDITEMVDFNKKPENPPGVENLAASKIDKLLRHDSSEQLPEKGIAKLGLENGENSSSPGEPGSKNTQSFVSNVRILSCIHCIHESCHEEYRKKKYKNYQPVGLGAGLGKNTVGQESETSIQIRKNEERDCPICDPIKTERHLALRKDGQNNFAEIFNVSNLLDANVKLIVNTTLMTKEIGVMTTKVSFFIQNSS